MVTQEIIIDHSNGSQYVKIKFEVIWAKPLTEKQWYEVNHKIEDLIEEVCTLGKT